MSSGGWNTIESDAGVFTSLIEQLGVRGAQFEELISLDTESLNALSPVYGVIFLFKYPTNEPPRPDTSTPHSGTYDHSAASDLFFASQVIQNACGTQALLSLLLNKSSATTTISSDPHASDKDNNDSIQIGPSLSDFLSFTSSFPPSIRGEALSNSDLIRTVHNSFARSSPFIDETVRQATGDEDVYHFIAYTSLRGVLYELDGLHPAPISHGACEVSDFNTKVIPVLQKRIERYPATEIRFNLLALTRDLRDMCRERGDWEGLEREEAKRRGWAWENSLRKHNFLGFAKEVLLGVVKEKSKTQGAYEEWVEGAVKRTREKIERKGGGGGGGGGEVGMEIDS